MRSAAQTKPFVSSLIACLAGPLVWTVHFFFMYAAATLVCVNTGSGAGGGIFVASASIATVVAVLALGGLALQQWKVLRRLKKTASEVSSFFMRGLSIALAGLSLMAVLWSAFPTLLLTPC
jgi:hypothetical protein